MANTRFGSDRIVGLDPANAHGESSDSIWYGFGLFVGRFYLDFASTGIIPVGTMVF